MDNITAKKHLDTVIRKARVHFYFHLLFLYAVIPNFPFSGTRPFGGRGNNPETMWK